MKGVLLVDADSDVEEDGGLVGVLHFLDAEDGSVDLIVDPGKVGYCGTLSDTTKLVIDGSVAEADPALVSTEIRHRDATQVSADGRSADN